MGAQIHFYNKTNKTVIAILLVISLGILTACQPSEQSNVAENETGVLASASPMDNAVDQTTILAAENSGWRSHGRTYSEQRYSPLRQVDTDTVNNLGLAWSFDLNASRGVETTPIVHDGLMYVTSTWNIVYALDARTGAEVWSFDPKIDKEQAGKGCCDAVNRGVALWGDSVFTGTLDGRLISLNAKTGTVNWDVQTVDKSKPYTITGAPRIVKGKVLIGNGGAELGVRGYISAYDAQTGEQVWRFYTVPGNPADGFENDTIAMAAKTWTGEYWTLGGGGTVWDSMAYDPELDLLYFGVGNGSPWNHSIRSPEGGDNLFLSSIVAVRPDSGEYVWHYQSTPAETWDYTATQHMILADLDIDGTKRKVIMQAPKNGFFYVIDRATGEFISAKNFVPVTWATHIDQETGRPIENPAARYSGKAPAPQLPGPLGAHNWHPMSFNPDTGLVYIPAQEAPWVYADKENFEVKVGGWNTGTDFTFALLPSDAATFKALKSAVKGRLLAWDPIKQEPAWSFEHNSAWNGGVLSTGGNLVFQGTADAHFAAYDAQTGERKWRFFTQTGVVAAPITYELDGEQYVAVASGWGGSFVLGYGGVLPTGSQNNAGRLLVFKLGETGKLPALENIDVPKLSVPEPLPVDEAIIKKGVSLYANNCVACHGDHAFSSGLTPNLRYSAITASAEAWKSVIIDGSLASRGMPNFGSTLSTEEAEMIRAYVISEANSGRNEAFYKTVDAQQ